MVRRIATVAVVLTGLAGGVSACGGDDSAPELSLDPPTTETGRDDLLGDEPAGGDGDAGERTQRGEEGRTDTQRSGDQGEQDSGEGSGSAGSTADDGADGGSTKRRDSPPLDDDARRAIEAVQATLREFIRRVNARDASVCTELVTANYLKETTGRRGDAAVRKCRSDISSAKGRVELLDINGVEVDGRKALIQFSANVGGTTGRQIYRLVAPRDRWLIDGDGTADAAG